jgi:hypothetical protein
MSNFFENVKNDIDKVEEELLGPDYNYSKRIKSPDELGMSSHGSISTLTKNITGLIGYVNVLAVGGGRAQKTTSGPLGDRFFLKTGAKCKNVDNGELVHRSIYVDNIPDGSIPFITEALGGLKLTTFEGLVPGVMSNLARIHPMQIFQSFMTGSTPDCKAITLNTVDKDHNFTSSTETAFLTLDDIKMVESFETLNDNNDNNDTDDNIKNKIKNYSRMPDDIYIKIYYSALGLFGLYILMRLFKKNKK